MTTPRSSKTKAPREGGDDDFILRPMTFSGTMTLGADSASVTSEVTVSGSGELTLKFIDLPMNQETRFILLHAAGTARETDFRFVGTSADDRTLSTDSLYFSQIQHGGTMNLTGKCSRATIKAKLNEPQTTHTIRYFLRAFQAFRGFERTTTLGRVVMGGDHAVKDFTKTTGQLALAAADGLSFLDAATAKDARTLLDHVLLIMSFASGSYLRAPIRETYAGDFVETEILNLSKGEAPSLPPQHYLNLDGIFGAAVDSYGQIGAYNGLDIAIEWLLMPTTYNEIRLIKGMVALENLVSKSGGHAEMLIDSAAKDSLRAVVKEWLKTANLTETQDREILAKINEAGRTSLESNIRALLEKWAIPLNNLPESALRGVVRARNNIVHRGIYYGDDPDVVPLWTHVTVVHEILTRIVLTAVKYAGPYYSYIGGYHQRRFPACTAS